MTNFHITAAGRKLAYAQIAGQGIGVVFLGGFRSDMSGTKAVYLADWTAQHNRPFLRFDYSGHGQSDGAFEDGCIGDWFADALDIISARAVGPQILVGSSMGGWISLLIARAQPAKVAALIGIAAAPDFTEDSMWEGFSDTQKDDLIALGKIEIPSDYDGPYTITRRLIEDGRKHLVLRSPLDLPFSVRLLQGTADTAVPVAVATRLMDHINSSDIRLTLVKGVEHRFSSPACLDLITQTIAELPLPSA